MLLYEIMTEVAERVSNYPERRVEIPIPQSPVDNDKKYHRWYRKNEWRLNYAVAIADKPRAVELATKAWEIFKADPKSPRLGGVLWHLKKLAYPSPEKRTPLQAWSHMAVQLPNDVSGGPSQALFQRILSEKYQGKVLEAMCGWNSNFLPSGRRTVIALDYCREALERYPYPQRQRILCDLNAISTVEDLGFCPPGSLDVISICFGYKYPHSARICFSALGGLLKSGGKVVFIESPTAGYTHMTKRGFHPGTCRRTLQTCGFREVHVEKLVKGKASAGLPQFYLIEGVK